MYLLNFTDKDYSKSSTLSLYSSKAMEYKELRDFVDEHCKVESHAIAPSLKVKAPLQVLLDYITRNFEFMYHKIRDLYLLRKQLQGKFSKLRQFVT